MPLRFDVDHAVPPRLVAFKEVAIGVDEAGVVDEHVDGAEARLHLVDHGCNLFAVRDIGGDAHGLPGAECFYYGEGSAFVDIVDGDVCAFGREALDDRTANSVASTRNQNDLAFKPAWNELHAASALSCMKLMMR